MAAIIKKAPIPEIKVNVSFNRIEENAKATITSVKRMIVEFTAEIDFKPSDHKQQGITQQKTAVYSIASHASPGSWRGELVEKYRDGIKGSRVANIIHVIG